MAIVVPLGLLAVAIVIIMAAHAWSSRKAERAKEQRRADKPAKILVHSINDDRCTGCDACVVVCPTDVLELVQNKSRVLRFGDCIQCEQCMWACPTQALVMHFEDKEPPAVRVPALDPYYQTGIMGMYLIGEVAGKPLVKNAANIGRAVIEHMRQEGLQAAGDDGLVDVVIVGSGPGGLSAALTCIQHGLTYVLLEKDQLIASTVARYPKGKDVMAEPYDVRNVSYLPVFDATKEEMVALWDQLLERVGVEVHRGEAVEAVQQDRSGSFVVTTTVAQYVGQRVVLATGTRGKPRTLGVPGENLPKVFSLLDDPEAYRGQNVLVVGGGDSAIEAAIALAEQGAKVVLSYRGKSFSRAQPKNRLRVQEMAQQGKVKLLFGSGILGFDEQSVTLKLADGQQARLANAAAFVLIGADAPIEWLEKLGVEYVERPHWYALGSTDQLVESLVGQLAESPREIEALARMALGQAQGRPASVVRPPVPEASVVVPLPRRPLERPAMMPGVVRGLGGPGLGDDGPMVVPTKERGRDRSKTNVSAVSSLEDFARGRQKDAAKKGKKPRAKAGGQDRQEVTRLLRALRDEGARLADVDSGVELRSDLSLVEISQARRVAGGGAMIGSADDNLPQIEARPAVIEGLTGVRRMSGIFDARESRAERSASRERERESRAERAGDAEREVQAERGRVREREREERMERVKAPAPVAPRPARAPAPTPEPERRSDVRGSGERRREAPASRDADLWSPRKSALGQERGRDDRPRDSRDARDRSADRDRDARARELEDHPPGAADADPTRMVPVRAGSGSPVPSRREPRSGVSPRTPVPRGTPSSSRSSATPAPKSGMTPSRRYPDVKPSFLDEPSPYESIMASSPRPKTGGPVLEDDSIDPTNLVRSVPASAGEDDFLLTPVPELKRSVNRAPLPSLSALRRPGAPPEEDSTRMVGKARGAAHDADTRFTGAVPDDGLDLVSDGEELDPDDLISIDEHERAGTDHG